MRNKIFPLWQYCAILAIFNLVLFNVPLIGYAYDKSDSLWLTTCLSILVLVLNFFACYLVCYGLRIVGRVLIGIANIFSALATYYVINYKILMDETMVGNVFNTNYGEASGFMTWQMWLVLLLVGLLPLFFILGAKVDFGRPRAAVYWLGGSLGVSIVVILINMSSVLWIGDHDTELGGLAMPWSYTVNTVRHFNKLYEASRPEEPLPDAKFRDDDKCVVVLVIGESARRANFSLYGYPRPTNPLLSKIEGLHIYDAKSNATYTTAGVRAILEHKHTGKLYEILPNYLYRHGVDVEWRTSNWGEPPVHVPSYLKKADLAQGTSDDKYDGVLIRDLAARITSSAKSKVFIVLHTSTSHGPAYTDKYPPKFAVFGPVCDNVEAATKDKQALVNAYDNSVVYTDYLLNEVVSMLNGLEGYKATMLFISDHGESLGENNLYMHGVPLDIAPKEQYEIPCFVWSNDTTRVFKPRCEVDQHCVFHTVLGLIGLDSPIYDKSKDLVTP